MAKYQGRIFQEIEKAADYNPPRLYDLLTFHNSVFGTQPDSTADEFATTLPGTYIPLTAALLPDRTKILPFVVGLLPPATTITGRLLDRSRSLPTAGVVNTDAATGTSGATGPTTREAVIAEANKWPGNGGDKNKEAYLGLVKTNPTDPYPFLSNSGCALTIRGLWNRLGVTDPRINGVYNPGTAPGNIIDVAKDRQAWSGGDKLAKKNSVPKPGDAVQVKRPSGDHFYTVISIEADGSGYKLVTVEGGQPSYNKPGEDIPIAIDRKTKHWTKDGDDWFESNGKRQILGFADVEKVLSQELPYQPNEVLKGDVISNAGWAKDGPANANKAQQSQTLNAGTSVDNPDLGKKYMAAQASLVKALQIAVAQAAATPPLKLLVNPESFKVSNQKIISDGNWGRNGAGTGLEHWGDAQDTISVSGKVAGFYAFPSKSSQKPVAGGLSRAARNFSAAYQNFLSLFLIYRNNGGVWLEDFADARDAQTVKPNNLALVGSIYIYYDSTLYIGSFDSFEMTESDVTPFTLSYSFNFTVRQTFLLDRLADNSNSPSSIPTSSQPTESNPASAPVAPPPIPPGGIPPASSLPDAPPGQFNGGFGIEDRIGLSLSDIPTNSTKGGGLPLEGLDYLGTYTPR